MAGYSKDTEWSDRDRLLVLAWEFYDATLCDGCGQDKQRSMNIDMEGWYEVREYQCQACAALESHRDKQKDRDFLLSYKEFVIDTRPPDDVPREWVLDLTASSE